MRTIVNLATSVILLMHVPAAASLQPHNKPIIVRATPLSPEEARQRAVDFVKSTGVANGQKQVARWAVPICIKVIGISATQAAKVENHMLGVAREAGVPTALQGCEPNITVSFTADAGQIVRQVHEREPRQFRELSSHGREQLLNGTAPVRWWYATQMLDRDGMKGINATPGWLGTASTIQQGGEQNSSAGIVSLDGGDFVSTNQYNSGSNVRTPTIRSLYGATVVVDATAAGKTPVDSIAAYAAMIAFAEMSADAQPPDSILGLFQPARGESSLTDWDMAFLKSLYRMPLDRRARIQRGHLVEALLQERAPSGSQAANP